jgi:hypothetical protein
VIFGDGADVDAPADMANRKPLEAITAPAIPSRIGWLIFIDSPPMVQTIGLVTTPKDGPPLMM